MIDTHAHLTDECFTDAQEVLNRAKEAGVKNIIVVGYNVPSSILSRDFANEREHVFYAAGVHPSDCETLDNGAIAALIELLHGDKCVAAGEIGIDRHYGDEHLNEQKEAFARQIILAGDIGLPFIVHSREASKEVTDILKANKSHIENGFLMHCYSESVEAAKTYLDLGAYFAFGGALTFKNSKRSEVLKALPKDRIVFETDCPYMNPEPKRGKRNEPANIKYIYERAALELGISLEELIALASKNASELFKKARFI